MSELATSAEPAYLNRLALQRLPFAKVKESSAFYDGSHIKQRRLLLLHLARATRAPILLQAETGMGKTTLLGQLQRQPATDIRFCSYLASKDRLNRYRLILEALDADTQGLSDEQSCLTEIQRRVQQLRRINIVPVLVVDDVEALTEQDKQDLTSWLLWQDEASAPLWQAILATSTAFQLGEIDFQKLDLPALEADDIEPYLGQRLHAAGYQGESLFDDKTLKRFYRASGGNPAKLNQLAHQYLLGQKQIKQWLVNINWSFNTVKRWSGVAALILLTGLVLIFQQQINGWVTKPEQVEKEISIPDLVKENEVATVVVGENDQNVEPQEARDELATLLANIPAQNNTDADSLVEVTDKAAETGEELAPKQSDTQRDSLTKVEDKLSQLSEEHTEPSEQENTIFTRDWIMSQKTTDYTFQLMGAWEEVEVDEYIEKYALTGQVARFTSLRNNKPWHVLIYGVYPSKKAALQASNNWPAPLNSQPTWLRRFDSVQKQIRDKGVTP